MARARQARRIARNHATQLGAASGAIAGSEFVHETEREIAESIACDETLDGDSDRSYDDERTAALQRAIGTDWDSSGVAAQFDRCPLGFESAYWAACNAAADRVVREALTA